MANVVKNTVSLPSSKKMLAKAVAKASSWY